MSIDLDATQICMSKHWRPTEAGMAPSDAVLRAALALVLDSEAFRKAQRMRRLLQFLVEQRLAGSPRATTEYAVGIGVFDRDPATYNTCDDPIVRVQIGRLRDKLQSYYADPGNRSTIRFTIPIGSYMPEIEVIRPAAPHIGSQYLLAVAPLGVFTNEKDGVEFAHGLNDELTHQLFEAFGRTIVSHTANVHGSGVSHRLECGLRVHGTWMRLSVRLLDSASGCVVWSTQLDEPTAYAIAVQERLSLSIRDALMRYFARDQP